MGTTPKPLRILVTDPAMLGWAEVQKLIAQKHTVTYPPELTEGYDLILGPNCWRMDEQLRDYLEDAIVEARKLRYPKGDTNEHD